MAWVSIYPFDFVILFEEPSSSEIWLHSEFFFYGIICSWWRRRPHHRSLAPPLLLRIYVRRFSRWFAPTDVWEWLLEIIVLGDKWLGWESLVVVGTSAYLNLWLSCLVGSGFADEGFGLVTASFERKETEAGARGSRDEYGGSSRFSAPGTATETGRTAWGETFFVKAAHLVKSIHVLVLKSWSCFKVNYLTLSSFPKPKYNFVAFFQTATRWPSILKRRHNYRRGAATGVVEDMGEAFQTNPLLFSFVTT
jgi:hypothetical protein